MFTVDPEMPVAVTLTAGDWILNAVEMSKAADAVMDACQERVNGFMPCTGCCVAADAMLRMATHIMSTVGSVAETIAQNRA